MGLLLLGSSTVAFGWSDSIAELLAWRVLQGIAGGCIQVAGMALLLQVSDNIERDVGLDQVAIGLGFIIGPPAGGMLFAALGFKGLNLALGALPLVELLALLLVSKRLASITVEKAVTTAASGGARGPLLSTLSAPIAATCTTSLVAFCAMGLLEPFVEEHLERALGATMEEVGAIFSIPCVVFTIVSAFAGLYTKALGFRRVIATGLLLMLCALLCLGPAPFLLSLPWTRPAAWVVQMLGFVTFGVGFSFVVTAVVPLMNVYLTHLGPKREDVISSLSCAAASLGEFVGPILGGLLAQYMPRRREISCRESAGIADCRTAASWTAQSYAVVLAVALLGFWVSTRVDAHEGKEGVRKTEGVLQCVEDPEKGLVAACPQ